MNYCIAPLVEDIKRIRSHLYFYLIDVLGIILGDRYLC